MHPAGGGISDLRIAANLTKIRYLCRIGIPLLSANLSSECRLFQAGTGFIDPVGFDRLNVPWGSGVFRWTGGDWGWNACSVPCVFSKQRAGSHRPLAVLGGTSIREGSERQTTRIPRKSESCP